MDRRILIGAMIMMIAMQPASAESIDYRMDNLTALPDNISHDVGHVDIDNTQFIGTPPNLTSIQYSIAEPNSYFTWSLSPANISWIGNDEDTFYIMVRVPENFPSGVYQRELYLEYGKGNATINDTFMFNLSVPIFNSFSVSSNNLTVTANNGEAGVVGNLTFANDGNNELTIMSDKHGSCKDLISTPKSFPLYRQLEETVTVQYLIPNDQSQGNYTCYINYTDGGNEEMIAIELNIVDEMPPTITNVSTPNLMATTMQEFFVEADDNLAVKEVRFNITRLEDYNVTTYEGNETVVEKRERNVSVGYYDLINIPSTRKYKIDFMDSQMLGVYYVKIAVEDTTGNVLLDEAMFKVLPLDALKYYTNVEQAKIKYGYKRYTMIFNLTKPTPIDISVVDMNYEGNWSVFIKSPGDVENYINSKNNEDVLTYDDIGSYEIGIYGDAIGTLYGKIHVEMIEQHVDVSDIVVDAEFTNYTVPLDFINNTFTWGWESWQYHDEGDEDLSWVEVKGKRLCVGGSCDSDEMGVRMTLTEKKAIEDSYLARMEVQDIKIGNYRFYILMSFLVAMSAVGGFLWKYHFADSFNFIQGRDRNK